MDRPGSVDFSAGMDYLGQNPQSFAEDDDDYNQIPDLRGALPRDSVQTAHGGGNMHMQTIRDNALDRS